MITMPVTTLGLLPAALSHAIGSDSQRPFTIVIVGGLIAALVMSIFLLPTGYVWIAGEREVLPQAMRCLKRENMWIETRTPLDVPTCDEKRASSLRAPSAFRPPPSSTGEFRPCSCKIDRLAATILCADYEPRQRPKRWS